MEQPALPGMPAIPDKPKRRTRARSNPNPSPGHQAADSTCSTVLALYTSILPDAQIDAAARRSLMTAIEKLGEAKLLARFRWLAECPDDVAARKRAWIRKDSIPLTALCRLGKAAWMQQVDVAAEKWSAPPGGAEAAWNDMMARQWMAKPVDLTMKHAESTDRRSIRLHEDDAEHERRRRAWSELWRRWVNADPTDRRIVKAQWLLNYGGAA